MSQPGMTLPAYYDYYGSPVKLHSTDEGGVTAWRLSENTGRWEPANALIDKVLFAGGQDIDRLAPAEFVQLVEEQRARHVTGDGPVHALYETMRAIMDRAYAERRTWTSAETALIRGLARRTYVMFEEELQSHGDPAAEPDLGR